MEPSIKYWFSWIAQLTDVLDICFHKKTKIMKVKAMAKFLLSIILLTVIVCTGCSKDDDNATSGLKAGKVKATITVSNEFIKADGYSFRVIATGATSISGKHTDWLVNGEKRTGIQIELGADDFAGGKTVILEATDAVITGLIVIQGSAGVAPYTVTYKVEKGGETRGEASNDKIEKGQQPAYMRSIELND